MDLIRDRLIQDAEHMGLTPDELLSRLVGIRGDEEQLAAVLNRSALLPQAVPGATISKLLAHHLKLAVKKEAAAETGSSQPDLGFFEDTTQRAQAAHLRTKPEVRAAIAAELDNQMRAALGLEGGVDPTEVVDDEQQAPEVQQAVQPEGAARSSDEDSIDTTTRKMQAMRRRNRPGGQAAMESTSSSKTISSEALQNLRRELQARIKREPEPVTEEAPAPAPVESPSSQDSAVTTIIEDPSSMQE